MIKQLYCCVIFLFMIASGVFADEPVDVDNSRIQQYRGHQGIWTRFESTSSFNSLIH
jgi:hypothetical protein